VIFAQLCILSKFSHLGSWNL